MSARERIAALPACRSSGGWTVIGAVEKSDVLAILDEAPTGLESAETFANRLHPEWSSEEQRKYSAAVEIVEARDAQHADLLRALEAERDAAVARAVVAERDAATTRALVGGLRDDLDEMRAARDRISVSLGLANKARESLLASHRHVETLLVAEQIKTAAIVALVERCFGDVRTATKGGA